MDSTFCDLCCISFDSKASLEEHCKTEHASESESEEGSSEEDTSARHDVPQGRNSAESEDQGMGKVVPEGPGYGCGDCTAAFSSFQELYNHMEEGHTEVEEAPISPQNLSRHLKEGDIVKALENEERHQRHEEMHLEEEDDDIQVIEEFTTNPNFTTASSSDSKTDSEDEIMVLESSSLNDCGISAKLVAENEALKQEKGANLSIIETQNEASDTESPTEKDIEGATSTDKQYYCTVCNLQCYNQGGFVMHNRVHTGHPCSLCHTCFYERDQLKQHSNLRTKLCQEIYRVKLYLIDNIQDKENDLKCTPCKMDFSNMIDHQFHLRRVHGKKPFYCCPICNGSDIYKSDWRQSFVQHLNVHHIKNVNTGQIEEEIQAREMPLEEGLEERCNEGHEESLEERCKEDTDSKQVHVGKRSSKKLRKVSVPEFKIQENIPDPVVEPIHCFICLKDISSPKSLTFHDEFHKCLNCNSCFTSNEKLQQHKSLSRISCGLIYKAKNYLIKAEIQNSLCCGRCDVKFSGSFEHQYHMESFHAKKASFTCPICNDFTHEEDWSVNKVKNKFARHIIAHMNESSIKSTTDTEARKLKGLCCIVCKIQFNNEKGYQLHNRFHSGLRCQRCNAWFSDKHSLEKHMRQEVLKKACNEIYKLKTFINKTFIKDISRCIPCKMEFSNTLDHQFHRRSVHGLTPLYNCHLCDDFPSSDRMSRNQFVKHMEGHMEAADKTGLAKTDDEKMEGRKSSNVGLNVQSSNTVDEIYNQQESSSTVTATGVVLASSSTLEEFNSLDVQETQGCTTEALPELQPTHNLENSFIVPVNASLGHVQNIILKPFQCENCPEFFTTESNLIQHYNEIHLHELPCLKCTHRSKTITSVHIHIRLSCMKNQEVLKGQSLPCYYCNEVEYDINLLEKHILTVHRQLPEYWCRECSIFYSRKVDFLGHVGEFHQNEEERTSQKNIEFIDLSEQQPEQEYHSVISDQPCPDCTEYSFWKTSPDGQTVSCKFKKCKFLSGSSLFHLMAQHLSLSHKSCLPRFMCLPCGIWFKGACRKINLQRHQLKCNHDVYL